MGSYVIASHNSPLIQTLRRFYPTFTEIDLHAYRETAGQPHRMALVPNRAHEDQRQGKRSWLSSAETRNRLRQRRPPPPPLPRLLRLLHPMGPASGDRSRDRSGSPFLSTWADWKSPP